MFTVTLYNAYYCMILIQINSPVCYQRTISHVSLFYVRIKTDTNALSQQTILHIRIILAFISFVVWNKTQFNQFIICYIIQTKQIGSSLFYRVSVSLQCIWICSRAQSSASMSQAFM